MLEQISTVFGYVAGAVIFVATIFMLRAILGGPGEQKNPTDNDD